MTKMQSYNANGWKGFVNTEWIDDFDDLDQWLEQNPGETIVDKPTRTVTRVAMANSILYVKRVETLAVGDGRFLRNLTRKLKWLLRPSRAISVMKTTMKMLEAGVPCPTPILAARKRTPGKMPTDIFITLEAKGDNLKKLLEDTGNDQDKIELLVKSAARAVARLHEAGFVHGDCIPGNMIVGNDDQIAFIDNDRTFASSSHKQQEKNLVQFAAHLAYETKSLEILDIFIEAYCQAAQRNQQDRLLQTIKKGVGARFDDWTRRKNIVLPQ